MYKNLKEIAAHKQRLWFKKSYSREIFFLIGYWIVELVFLEWSFLYIKKINCSPPILNAYYMYVRGVHSARVFCMYNVFERHFCFRRVAILAVAAMNSFKFTGFFFRAWVAARIFHGYKVWYILVFRHVFIERWSC